ncbi:MAG: M24 family metallopeptidase, partial [Nitrososphaerales archaeon]
MEAKGVDALIALGESTSNNPELLYLVGYSIPRGGIYVKRRGQEPILTVGETDLGSAKQGRVKCVKSFGELGYYSLLAKDAKSAYIELIAKVLAEAGVEGKITIYGRHKANIILQVSSALQRRGLTVIQEDPPTLLEEVMMTKDDKEIEAIKLVGEAACNIIRKTIEQLAACEHKGTKLLYRGKELTVGDIKRLIKMLLAEYNLKPVDEPIFAPAPSSYDPHYTGLDSEPIILGEPIVFDLFPQGSEGYYFDVTRTISIGTPSKEFKQMYEAVFEAQQTVLDRLRSGMLAKEAMSIACEVFEKKGYDTPKTNHTLNRGFTHSLGHGIGLTIGERPYISLYSQDRIIDRQVFTIEPGLYDVKLGGV